MPNKAAGKTASQSNAPKYEPGQLVNVFNFDADEITLAPKECFSHPGCTGCPGHQEGKCRLHGPKVSKNDILTVIDCHVASDVMFQMVLLLTPDGLIGSIDNEMLDFVPETMPEEEEVK